MQELSTILVPLSIVAGLALGVERLLEVLKHIMQVENRVSDGSVKDVVSRANTVLDSIDEAFSRIEQVDSQGSATAAAAVAAGTDAARDKHVEPLPADGESDEHFPPPPIAVIPATPRSRVEAAKTAFLQLAAAGLGMMLAWIFDLHLLSIFMQGYGVQAGAGFRALDVILTGLVIGGGSQPIHVLLRFLTEHKIRIPAQPLVQDKLVTSKDGAPALVVESLREASEPAWKAIDYRGGINPERLENTHRRPGEPTLIVYHHTAMSSTARFQDIVDEFLLTKKWLTGYHCVVMPDGAIRPFCRWDRSGNHARGRNARSLGIAFHGNFHAEVGDRFSNADGRYGNRVPTEAQLRAGARVIALWRYLYGIEAEDVRPHHAVMEKGYTVCPGSAFPEERLESLVAFFYEGWRESKSAQAAIDDFRRQPYVYALGMA